MAPARGKGGGCGSALGCVVVLGVAGFAVWHWYPQIRAHFPGRSAPIEWGQAHMGGGLRVAVLSADVETTEVDDVLGQREGDQDLHVTLEITNMGDSPVTYRPPQLLRAKDPTLTDDRGHEAHHVAYGDKTHVEGQLADGDQIEPHDKETHDLIFKVPAKGATSFLLSVDMAMFGSSGVVQFRIPATEVKGLR